MSVNQLKIWTSPKLCCGPFVCLACLVYTIPIDRIIHHHGLSYHLYADDVQIYTYFKPSNYTSIASALDTINSLDSLVSMTSTMENQENFKLEQR